MQSVPFGTPSLFNSRRKASDGKEESPPQGLVQGTPCTPSFDGDTPTMLRRLRSPPPSPTGKFKRDAVKLAFAAVVGILMLSTLFSYRMTMGSAADERLSVLTTLVRSQQDEMIELQKTVRTQSTTIASLAARSSKSQAAPKPKLEGTTSGVGAAGVASPEKSSGRKHVHVVFRFDEDRRLGKEVQLFWLYENNTEQLYTTIPAGLQADETTFPGQCWRAVRVALIKPRAATAQLPRVVGTTQPPNHLAVACPRRVLTLRGLPSPPFTWQRDPRSGNHLLSYCATSEPLQTVHIAPSTNVKLDFHFPPTAKLAQRVRVLALGDGSSTPSLVGELAQGGRVSTRAVAGAKFKVVEVVKGLDRPLLQMTVGLYLLWSYLLSSYLPHTRLTFASHPPHTASMHSSHAPAHVCLPAPPPTPGEPRGGAAC